MRIIALNSDVCAIEGHEDILAGFASFELHTGNFLWRELGC